MSKMTWSLQKWTRGTQYKNFQRNLLQNMIMVINPLPEDKILDWSKLKQIADDILKCI